MKIKLLTSLLKKISFLIIAVATFSSRSQAGLTLDLQLIRYSYENEYYYHFAPYLNTNSTAPNAAFGHYLIASPGSSGYSLEYDYTPGGFNFSGGGGYGYYDFDSFMDQLTNGVWSITVTNVSTTNIYHFTVSANITSNSIPKVTVLYPAYGSAGIPAHPTFSWQGPVDADYIELNVHDTDYNFYEDASLDSSETAWTPSQDLPSGTNYFTPNYYTDSSSLVVATTPLDGSLNPISAWESTSKLVTYFESQFVVGGSHTNIAHYTFDYGDFLGFDSSGHGNDITSTANFGCGSLTADGDSWIGDYAALFDTVGGSCPNWFLPPTNNLLQTLAGSFSVSLWLKTSDVFGGDDDDGYSGEGIVSAFNGPGGNTVIPMALTGHKLAFFTGGSPQTTLHSETDISTGDYVHLVVTRDRATGEKKIYVDGVLDASDIGSSDSLDTPEELQIGYNSGSGKGIDGLIDDVQFYSGVLSADNVAFLFDNPGSVVDDTGGQDFNAALNTSGFNWVTGGNANWFVQSDVTHDNDSAAQSGDIDSEGESWIETTVVGPGTLSFWWKVSSEEGWDFLEFLIDDNSQDKISGGNEGWQNYSYSIDAGPHTLKWRYYKDDSGDDYLDTAYLDEVSFTPIINSLVVITKNPFSQTNSPGYKVALFAAATGDPTPTFQWYKVGTGLITGATNGLYIPANSGTAGVAGDYYAIASNTTDSTNTSTATVTFVSAPLPPDWSRAFSPQLYQDFNQISTNYGIACLVDSTGNIYSANSFTGTNTFASDTFTAGSNRFGTILMKQTATGTAIWGRGLTNNENGNAYPQCLAPAPNDGVYMSGVFLGTNWLGTNKLVETTGATVYLARFAANGDILWVRTIGGTNFCFQSYHQLVADPAGNITISALIQNTVSFGGTNITVDGQKGVLAQYDANGNLNWVQVPSGWFQHLAYKNGRIYGSMDGHETNYAGGLTNLSDRHWSLVALNATNGQAAWLRGIGSDLNSGSNFDTPRIAVSDTNVFVVGTSGGSNAVFGPFTASWTGASGQYFARYDTNGNAQLATTFGSETTIPWTAVADASGNVYVGGDFDTYSVFGNQIIAAPFIDSIGTGFPGQTFVAKFAPNGNPLWARSAQSTNSYANLRDIALASDGVWSCGFVGKTASYGTNNAYGTFTCIGTPLCQIQYFTGGVLAKITDGVAVALPVNIINSVWSGGNFSFQFQSQPGFTHFVESRTNVATGTWTPRTNLSGDGSLKTIQLPATNLSADFFRVRTQ